MRKNRQFRTGAVLTVIEGLLSSGNFMLLYEVMRSLWNGTVAFNSILRVSGILALVFALRLVLYSIGYTQGCIGGAAVSRQVRLFLGDKIKRIPLSEFAQGNVGQYINTMTSDVNNYEKILTHKTGDLIKNITLSVMLIVFTTTIWLPGGIILLITDLLLIPALWLSYRAVRKYGGEKNAICTEAISSLVEYTEGIQTFRSYGIGGIKNKTTIAAMKRFSNISYLYEAKVIPIGICLSIFNCSSLPIIMWAAFDPWRFGVLDTVSYILLCMLPLFLSKLAGTIFVDFTSYKNLMISKNNITKIIKKPEEQGYAVPFLPASYEISFVNVDFSYVPGEDVLKEVNFTAESNKLTAIVGDSGAGKSTILNLIAKYFEPQSGTVAIGGYPINNVASEQVLPYISMVTQDVFLFDDTVRENIRHARHTATDAEIEEACKAAHCDSFIRKLEDGYDTPIGENGKLLSGGERQRLSIARAFLKNSPILLLDEATASLDIENELAVKQAIVNLLAQRKTVIMIAHTLSVIKQADQILVMERGRIIERGTHSGLLALGGKYASMWRAEKQLTEI
jgi:ATP-binding cassette subfamily B protein